MRLTVRLAQGSPQWDVMQLAQGHHRAARQEEPQHNAKVSPHFLP